MTLVCFAGLWLLVFFILPTRCGAQQQESIEELEIRLLCQSAERWVEAGKYDEAFLRLSSVISRYGKTPATYCAQGRREALRHLHLERPKSSTAARVGLGVFGTIYGSWAGLAAGILTESLGVGSLGMVGGPVIGLQATLAGTRNARLSDGQMGLIAFGGAWGTSQAIALTVLADSYYKTVVGASLVGGAVGLLASTAIVQEVYVTKAEAQLVNAGATWGTWFAFCGYRWGGYGGVDPVMTSFLVGGNMGLGALGWWATRHEMSGARAGLINLGGIVGTLYGLGGAILFDVSKRRTFGAVLTGGALGLAGGIYGTRHYDAAVRGLFGSSAKGEWSWLQPAVSPLPGERGAPQEYEAKLHVAQYYF